MSSGQGASAVQGLGPTAGDLILLRSTPEPHYPHYLFRGGFTSGNVTMAGAGPSGVAVPGASGFTTIYPVTECMEVGEEQMEIQHPQ